VTTTAKRIVQIVVGFAVGIIALNLLASALDESVGGSEPGGAPGSSYATSSEGFAAYADLLARYGHRVSRQRGNLADAQLDPGTTLVIGGREGVFLDDDELDVLRSFVASGGRLVVASSGTPPLNQLVTQDFTRVEGTDVYRDIAPDLGDVSEVVTAGGTGFDIGGSGAVVTPLVSERDVVFAATFATGDGAVIGLADPSPLENELLGVSDNAAFGIELAGPEGRPVVFAEGVHGHDSSEGLQALPTNWKIAILGIGAAGALFAWSRARRVGPPDQPNRALPPARAEYVNAMAGSLEQTRDPAAALADLAKWTRDHAERNAIEIPESERKLLEIPPKNAQEIIDLGRLAARVARGDIEERTRP